MFENPIVIGILGMIIVILGSFLFITTFLKKAQQGQALIRTGLGGTRISFSGMTVIPAFHRLQTLDISLKTIEVNRFGHEGLRTKDGHRVDLRAVFLVRVNPTPMDVRHASQLVGPESTSSSETLNNAFVPIFTEALLSTAARYTQEELISSYGEFRERTMQEIGHMNNGYVIDDLGIDYLERSHLAEDNAYAPVGHMCTITTTVTSSNAGTAKIELNGAAKSVPVITLNKTSLKEGDRGLLFGFLRTNNHYLVEPYVT